MRKGPITKFNERIEKLISGCEGSETRAFHYLLDGSEPPSNPDCRLSSEDRAKLTYAMFKAAEKANHVKAHGAGRVARREKFHEQVDDHISATERKSVEEYLGKSSRDASEMDRSIKILENARVAHPGADDVRLNKVWVDIGGTSYTIADAKPILMEMFSEPEGKFDIVWKLMAPTLVGSAAISNAYEGCLLSAPEDAVVSYKISTGEDGAVIIDFETESTFSNSNLMISEEVRKCFSSESLVGRTKTTVTLDSDLKNFEITTTFNPDGIKSKSRLR